MSIYNNFSGSFIPILPGNGNRHRKEGFRRSEMHWRGSENNY